MRGGRPRISGALKKRIFCTCAAGSRASYWLDPEGIVRLVVPSTTAYWSERGWQRPGSEPSLQAYLKDRQWFPTEMGVPQGGIISPTIANWALDGLQLHLAIAVGPPKWIDAKPVSSKINFVRYAD